MSPSWQRLHCWGSRNQGRWTGMGNWGSQVLSPSLIFRCVKSRRFLRSHLFPSHFSWKQRKWTVWLGWADKSYGSMLLGVTQPRKKVTVLMSFLDLCGPGLTSCDGCLFSKHCWSWMGVEIEVVSDGQGGWTTWGKVVPYSSYKDRALFLMFSTDFHHCHTGILLNFLCKKLGKGRVAATFYRQWNQNDACVKGSKDPGTGVEVAAACSVPLPRPVGERHWKEGSNPGQLKQLQRKLRVSVPLYLSLCMSVSLNLFFLFSELVD